jgi:hypothetical protein
MPGQLQITGPLMVAAGSLLFFLADDRAMLCQQLGRIRTKELE